MSVMNTNWYFADVTDNSTQSIRPSGILVTAGASGVMGTIVNLFGAAVTHDIHCLYLSVGSATSGAGTNPLSLLDVVYDPLGGTSWSTFIKSLLVGGFNVVNTQPYPMSFIFPIYVPSGASFGMQGQCKSTLGDKGYRVVAVAQGNPSRPDMWWSGSKVETLGDDTVNTKGTTIVSPATAGVWGAWTNVGGLTSGRYGCVQVGFGGADSTAYTAQNSRLKMGINSLDVPFTTQWVTSQTTQNSKLDRQFPTFIDIPAGTQLQMASETGAAGGNNQEVVLYGVY